VLREASAAQAARRRLQARGGQGRHFDLHQRSRGPDQEARGLEAPFAAADAVRAAIELPFDEGFEEGTRRFLKLVSSDSRKRSATPSSPSVKPPRSPEFRGTKARPVERVAIIARTMGGGYRDVVANAGIPVTLIETGEEQLKRGLGVMQKNYEAPRARRHPADAPASAWA